MVFAARITSFARIRIVGIVISTCIISGFTVADFPADRLAGGDDSSTKPLAAYGHSLRRSGGIRRWVVGLCRAVGVLLPTVDAG